jgi:hypothetical protein
MRAILKDFYEISKLEKALVEHGHVNFSDAEAFRIDMHLFFVPDGLENTIARLGLLQICDETV